MDVTMNNSSFTGNDIDHEIIFVDKYRKIVDETLEVVCDKIKEDEFLSLFASSIKNRSTMKKILNIMKENYKKEVKDVVNQHIDSLKRENKLCKINQLNNKKPEDSDQTSQWKTIRDVDEHLRSSIMKQKMQWRDELLEKMVLPKEESVKHLHDELIELRKSTKSIENNASICETSLDEINSKLDEWKTANELIINTENKLIMNPPDPSCVTINDL